MGGKRKKEKKKLTVFENRDLKLTESCRNILVTGRGLQSSEKREYQHRTDYNYSYRNTCKEEKE